MRAIGRAKSEEPAQADSSDGDVFMDAQNQKNQLRLILPTAMSLWTRKIGRIGTG